MLIANPTWTYDEFKHIGVDFASPSQVETYDARQKTNLEAEKELVRRLKISSGDSVIEFGSGTGAFSLASASVGAHVVAVDISQTMLDYAHRQAVRTGFSNVQFTHAGFLTYEHQGMPVDFVVTQFAFHHLPDFWKAIALRRIHHLLQPNGVFYLRDVVFSFSPEAYETYIEQWIQAVSSERGSGFSRHDFEIHVRDEYSTFGWILEGLLQRAGFSIAESNSYAPTYADYVCIKNS